MTDRAVFAQLEAELDAGLSVLKLLTLELICRSGNRVLIHQSQNDLVEWTREPSGDDLAELEAGMCEIRQLR